MVAKMRHSPKRDAEQEENHSSPERAPISSRRESPAKVQPVPMFPKASQLKQEELQEKHAVTSENEDQV